jgi:predicted nucleotidyltransferase
MALATTFVPLTLNELRTRLRSFCESHPIEKLEVFGSVAKEKANDESDVDLLDRESVERARNPIRRNEILGRALTIYERGA